MKQTCNSCHKELPVEQFNFRNKAAGTRHRECKKCHSAAVKTWYTKNSKSQKAASARWKAANKNMVLASKYGTTVEEIALLMSISACEICGSTKNLHIDHDHTSGKVRGRLCMHCNHGLGNFKDDIDSLRKAAVYLTERGSNPTSATSPNKGTR